MSLIATPKFPGAVASDADMLNLTNWITGDTQPTLASAMDASQTTATLATGTGAILPTANFEITIASEIIFVGARSGDSLTSLVRAAEGTTAATHSAAAPVNHYYTALHHNQLAAEIYALENWKAWRLHPDRPPTAPTAYDDEFDAATLNLSQWAWLNQASATATLTASRLLLTTTASTGTALNAIIQPLPSPNWQFTAKLDTTNRYSLFLTGLILQENATGKIATWGFDFYGTPVARPRYDRWPNPTGGPSNQESDSGYSLSTPLYLRLERTGSNLNAYCSHDGLLWQLPYTETITASFTTAPDHIGIFGTSTTSTAGYFYQLDCDWIRRTA